MKHEDFLTKANALKDKTILVIGDVMLDKYVYGNVSSISPEAPVPVMNNHTTIDMLGGAGNVANNVKSLGANVHLLTTIGVDDSGDKIKRLVADAGINGTMFTLTKQTTTKTRFVGNNQQQMMRFDSEDTDLINVSTQQRMLDFIDYKLYDAIIISDYGKGTIPLVMCREITFNGKAHGVKVFVDPKGTDYTKYADAYLVKPNLKEFEEALGYDRSVNDIQKANQIEHLAVTLGDGGIRLMNEKAWTTFGTQPKDVYDVSGAGDTVIAVLAAWSAIGESLEEAITVAMVAAGIVIEKRGTETVTCHEISRELCDEPTNAIDLDDAVVVRDIWRTVHMKVGFTNGCFDLIHPGHLSLLKTAKSHCDKLFVGINSDQSIKRIKGDDRPIQDQQTRANILLALECVDTVVIFDEDDPLEIINELKPDVLFKGSDYTIDTIVGAKEVHSYGGHVEIVPLKEGFSTTNIVEKIAITTK